MAFSLEFRPDLIVELGRKHGNSTCTFTQVANWLLPYKCQVLSLCLSNLWEKETLPNIRPLVPDSWFKPLEMLQTDILTFDFKTALANFQKILIFWDAHGYEIAECVLGEILPCLLNRPHVVIMHDLSDSRYLPQSTEQYNNNRLWKGNNNDGLRVRIGNINSAVEQAIAIVDFTSRNKLPLHSADHNLHTEFNTNIDKKAELQNCLGEHLFSLNAHWHWFSLDQEVSSYTFPRFCPSPVRQPQPSKSDEQLSLKTRLKVAINVLLNRYPANKFL